MRWAWFLLGDRKGLQNNIEGPSNGKGKVEHDSTQTRHPHSQLSPRSHASHSKAGGRSQPNKTGPFLAPAQENGTGEHFVTYVPETMMASMTR